MDSSNTMYINFDTSLAKANILAEDLQTFLDDKYGVSSERVKDSENTMDFGATLAIILAGPSIVALAKGIQAWLAKDHERTISVSFGPDRKVEGTGLTGKDITTIIEKVKGGLT